MDYRNADGSLAEMCGNGVRVFARYLVRAGLERPGRFVVVTRAGARAVEAYVDGDVTVDMGPATLRSIDGIRVRSGRGGTSWAADAVDVGNPHAVVWLDDLAEAGPLTEAPHVDPASAFPSGSTSSSPYASARATSRCACTSAVSARPSRAGRVRAPSVAAGLAAEPADSRPDDRWTVDVPGGDCSCDGVPTAASA